MASKLVVREVRCKSILSESGICDYALNCYTGCSHACAYCYARFMGRFHHPDKPWGSFVDVKLNAPQVLAKQIAGKGLFQRGSVFVSSVCDPYQPIEARYRLTRQCLAMLVEAGFSVHVQTKNDLVRRDFDLLAGQPKASLCHTITTLDDGLCERIEPGASPPSARLACLREAAKAGITIKAFVGPLLPGLSDTPGSLRPLLAELAKLPLAEVYVDRLNLRWGVWPALAKVLERLAPDTLEETRGILFSSARSQAYTKTLRGTVLELAQAVGLEAKLNLIGG
jgi:DNA repair photolyase